MCTDADVGYGLIARWMAAREVVTAPYGRWPPWRRPAALPGSLAVHRVVQHRHLGEDAFYTAENLYVDPNRGIRTVKHPTGGPVLAFERGGRALEQRRHAEFAASRWPGTEWFRLDDTLVRHIAAIAAGGDDPWEHYDRWRSEELARRA